MRKLIIVGGGIAGVSAAHSARAEYPDAEITIVSSDPYPFYNRIALNSYVTGAKHKDHLRFYPLGSLEERRISSLGDTAVSVIHRQRREVELSDKSTLKYDSLILATGAESILPSIEGINLDGVFPLWSLDDAMKIRGAIREAQSVFVLGAGVLGVEIAMALQEEGKQVTLSGSGERVLPRLLDNEAAACYLQELEARGVEVNLSRQISRVTRHGGRLRAEAVDGESWNCDLLLVMTGARPEISLASAAGLTCRQGILVDKYMGTADANILACGNCAEFQDGTSLLWNPARSQGEIAGQNAFDRKHELQRATETIHIKTPEIPVFACGQRNPEENGCQVIRDSGNGFSRSMAFDDDGIVVSATFVGKVHGAYDVEQGIRGLSRIPSAILELNDIDEILSYLEMPRLQEIYPRRTWVCRMCGYIYEGDDPPEICPVCSVGKDQFQAA